MIKGHTDVLMISESNLDNSVPDGQFLIEGYGAPFRLDRNKLGVVSCFFSAMMFLPNYFHLVLALKISFLGWIFESYIVLVTLKVLISNSIWTGYPSLQMLIHLLWEHKQNSVSKTQRIHHDLILTNTHLSFQWSCAIGTGLSDFPKMVLTVMKMHFPKKKPLSIPKIKKLS